MRKIVSLLLLFLLLAPGTARGADEPVVCAVLFYSPRCSFCQEVINEVLPPLVSAYGGTFRVLLIDTTQPEGAALHQEAVAHLQLLAERQGLPGLLLGDQLLVGTVEISQRLPDLIADSLVGGGVGWPELPGLLAAYPALGETANAATTPPATLTEVTEPLGLVLGIIVLLLMAGTLAYVGVRLGLLGAALQQRAVVTSPLVPVLALAGLGVAFYLTYVELTGTQPLCGPLVTCETLHNSPYASILGMPVALLGAVAYLVVAALWWYQRDSDMPSLAVASLLLVTLLSTAFSLYLTGVALFVLNATCPWCLLSSVFFTSLLVTVALSLLDQAPSPVSWTD